MSEQLLSDFEKHEVDTTRSLVECMALPPSSSKFRRIIMLLLRGHFSNAANYGEEYSHLGCYTWDDSSSPTLHVGFTHLPDDSTPTNYPGVYVGFGGVTKTKLAIADDGGMTDDYSGNYISKQNELTLVINHVAKEAGDAYDLADMSDMVLTAMGRLVMLQSGALAFEVEGYAEPKKETPSPDRYYTVAMSLKITYTHVVTRSVESHRIRRISTLVTLH
jgi:hypothetical protein